MKYFGGLDSDHEDVVCAPDSAPHPKRLCNDGIERRFLHQF